jgi:YaiO family outer membrane protein
MKKILIILLVLCSISLSAQEENKGGFQVLTGYETDFYKTPYTRTMHVANAGFGYKGGLFALYGKLNLGYLNAPSQHLSNQTQFELDYWQSINENKSTSFWLNYAYSASELFPEHRIVFEVWQKLGAGFLVSGGVNYYRFTDINPTIFNLGLEKYLGRFWIEAKTYLYMKEPDLKTSYSLTSRLFFNDVNFLQFGIGLGSAQDEPFIIESDLYTLFSYSAHMRYVTNAFNDKIRFYTGITYLREEYLSDAWRNRFSIGVGLTYNLY